LIDSRDDFRQRRTQTFLEGIQKKSQEVQNESRASFEREGYSHSYLIFKIRLHKKGLFFIFYYISSFSHFFLEVDG